ncbi:ZP domain-containing protein [Meloidogyne graminicola]|uniref:ZP domain-containing protein n=1 Tax=Meloidogyne graminicola TaxID=189291 RepID=A0A8S9ZUR5_9BILA|nr:ZP domain-containing protein [Meloidogyne graminicola]
MFKKFIFIYLSYFIASMKYSLAASPYSGDNNYYYPQQINNYGGGYSPPIPSPSPTSFLSTPDIIDNEVIEAPLIHCTDRGVEFSIRTKNSFRGNVYVQGQFGLSECRREFYNNDLSQAGIEIRLNDCGMIKERRPHGMSYSINLIVNFHPRFVTKVDRAYKILCSYQHTERPVGTDLEVGTVPTEPLLSDAILVPDCEYTMRIGDPNGPIATTTIRVGELIFHRWECSQDSRKNREFYLKIFYFSYKAVYGMLVKNCRVFDGGNENVTLIDERGCPTKTGVIQSPPVYSEALNIAYAPIFAFHFPDRSQMNFRCQIQSCNKLDNECNGLTPPNCPNNQNDGPIPTPYLYGQPHQSIIPQTSQGESYATFGNNQPVITSSTPKNLFPTYIGAGISPTWPPNALPLGSVLQGNPSQVLQGIGRPWPANIRRRVEKDEGQSLEHKILLATQQLMKQHGNESWPPRLILLNKLQNQHSPQSNSENTRRSAQRYFRPAEAFEQDELRLRQRRAEEKTQDVVAISTVTNDGLQGMDWSFENGKEKIQPRRSPTMKGDKTFTKTNKINESTTTNTSQKYQLPSIQLNKENYCLNRNNLVILIGIICLLSCILITICCCLIWDFLSTRRRCRKGLINSGQSNNKQSCFNFLSKNKISNKNNYQLPCQSSSPPMSSTNVQQEQQITDDPRKALAQIFEKNLRKNQGNK